MFVTLMSTHSTKELTREKMKKEEKRRKRVKCDSCGKLIHPLEDSYFVGNDKVLCWACLRIPNPQKPLTKYLYPQKESE